MSGKKKTQCFCYVRRWVSVILLQQQPVKTALYALSRSCLTITGSLNMIWKSVRANRQREDINARPWVSWHQCCCGLPQSLKHTLDRHSGNSCLVMNNPWPTSYHFITQALSHCQNNYPACDKYADEYSKWFLGFAISQFVSPLLNGRALLISHFASPNWPLSALWLVVAAPHATQKRTSPIPATHTA